MSRSDCLRRLVCVPAAVDQPAGGGGQSEAEPNGRSRCSRSASRDRWSRRLHGLLFLSQLAQLTELASAAWAADLDDPSQLNSASLNGFNARGSRISEATCPADQSGWTLLADFRQVRCLRVAPIPSEEHGPSSNPPLRTSSFLLPLLH